MGSRTRVYWLHALTPLHVGSGRSTDSFVDLPVAREKATGRPVVPGSAVKGVLRDHFEASLEQHLLDQAFGRPDDGNSPAQAGALVLSDARLVLLPVRSLYGTFAYLSSPLTLKRLARDLQEAQCESVPPVSAVDVGRMALPPGSRLTQNGQVFLEDLDFVTAESAEAEAWSRFFAEALFPSDSTWGAIFRERFAVVADEVFDFLCETGTEVHARVRLEDERKTVARGALWYEEDLPAESVLAGLVWCDRVFGKNVVTPDDILKQCCTGTLQLQLGGKATTGKGRVRCLFTGQGG